MVPVTELLCFSSDTGACLSSPGNQLALGALVRIGMVPCTATRASPVILTLGHNCNHYTFRPECTTEGR